MTEFEEYEELTPEMVEAGVSVLEESGRLSGNGRESCDPLIVRDIFIAMLKESGLERFD